MNTNLSAGTSLIALLVSVALPAQEWSLDRCLEYSEQNNNALLAVEQSVVTGTIDRKSTWSALLPEVDFTTRLDHYWRIPVQVFPGELLGGDEGTFVPVRMGTPWMGSYGLEGRLKLIDPQSWRSIKLATLREQAGKQELVAMQRMLQRNVHMAYHAAQLRRSNLETNRERLLNYTETHRLIERRFNQGQIDKITLNQSVALLGELEQRVTQADHGWQSALLDLKFWMGMPLDQSIATEVLKEPDLQIDRGDYSPSALPDYEVRKLGVELAEQQYRAAIAALFPTLHMTAGYQRLGFGQSIDFIGEPDWFESGYIGMTLRIPLLSLQRMAYQPKKQRSEMEVTRLRFENYLEEQQKTYLQEELQLNESWKAVISLRENLELAKENEALSRQKIDKGIIDMVQLRQIQQDLNTAQEKLDMAMLQLLKHFVERNYLQNY